MKRTFFSLVAQRRVNTSAKITEQQVLVTIKLDVVNVLLDIELLNNSVIPTNSLNEIVTLVFVHAQNTTSILN